MNLVHFVCLLAVLPMQTAATKPATAPPRIARFLELCETTRRGAILQLEHEIRKQRNAPSAERSPVKISQLEARLKQLQSREELVVPTIAFPPQVGAIGRLPDDACYVEQVVSPNEVLIRCHFRVPVTTVRDFRAYRDAVVQPVAAVVRGWKQHVSEGQDTTTREIFEVVGRDRYATQGGASRTVLVLKPFNAAELEPYLQSGPPSKTIRPLAAGASGG
jgi:hypothetical protein